MKNLLNSFRVRTLRESFKKAFYRFTLSFFLVFIIAVLFFILNHRFWWIEDTMFRAVFSLIVTLFLGIWVYLTGESNNFSYFKNNLLQLFPVVFWVLFFLWFDTWNMNDFQDVVFLWLASVWIFSYLFFAPYLKNLFTKNVKQSVYYTYFYKVGVVFLVASILSWAVWGLWSVAMVTVSELFDIRRLQDEVYLMDWAILSFGIFAPIFALVQIPSKKDYRNNYFNENIFFSFLVKFIAVPFVCIYFIILYVYSFKVLLTFWDWPKWEVTWMVIGFSVLGYVSYMISYIFEWKSEFIKVFRKYFPYVVIPQVFMLFYSIYLRIAQYDITINRYFVVVFGIWLLVISIYYIFSKKKHLSFIPAVLTLFTIVVSVWPWSVYNLPESRHFNKLKVLLVEAWILVDWKIIPLSDYSDIDKELWKKIYSEIDYVCDFNNCSRIKELFSEIYKEIEENDRKMWEEGKDKEIEKYRNNIAKFSWVNEDKVNRNEIYIKNVLNEEYYPLGRRQITEKITEKLKVKSYYRGINHEDEYINRRTEVYTNLSFPIDIKGYSKIYEIFGNNYEIFGNNNEYWKSYAYVTSDKELRIIKDYTVLKKIDISEIIEKIKSIDFDRDSRKALVDSEDLIFDVDWYKIVFTNIILRNPEYKKDTTWDYSNVRWYLLEK